MADKREVVIRRIISLPALFQQGGKTPVDLLRESGYLESPDSVSVDAVAEALRESPELVDRWLIWSENKRTDSGWYFERTESGDYIIGYFPAGKVASQTFRDPYSAAAQFIKLEIEDIRTAA